MASLRTRKLVQQYDFLFVQSNSSMIPIELANNEKDVEARTPITMSPINPLPRDIDNQGKTHSKMTNAFLQLKYVKLYIRKVCQRNT